jgi:hypothetical protein
MMDHVNVSVNEIGIAAVCWFSLVGLVGGAYVASRTVVTIDLFPDSTLESNARGQAFHARWAPRLAFLWRWTARATVVLVVILIVTTLAIWILN